MPQSQAFDGSYVEFVEVHDEPIHRRQFNNDFCWIYIAGFRPGETSLWHRHSENTLYLCVQNACAALNRPTDKEPFVHHASPGDLWWAMSKSTPYVHQVCLLPENTHPSIFFAMEILRPPPPELTQAGALEHTCYRLRREDSRAGIARVYDLKLEPGQSTGWHSLGFMGVILCLAIGEGKGIVSAGGGAPSGERGAPLDPFEDGSLSRVGGWKWIEGAEGVNARNDSDGAYEAVVVEWLGEGQVVDNAARL